MPNVKTYKREVEAYIRGVLDGSIVTGRLVRLAVERHVRDLRDAQKRGFYFSESHAEEAVWFFPHICRHSIGEWDGQPFELSGWQKFIVWCLFGWRVMSSKMRRFRKAFISMARKGGKSTFLAALALLLLVADNPIEAGAEIYVAATKEKQATIVHAEAVRMVQKSPSLGRVLISTKNNLCHRRTNGFFRPIGSDSDTSDGLNAHAVLKDEMHAWQERHRGLHEKLSSSFGARRQPLEAIITTAGDDRAAIWNEEQDFAERVVESVISGNVISDSYFSFIARLDDGDDPFDERNWLKANPNLGVSVHVDFLRNEAAEAKHKPTSRNKFLRYYCNLKTTSREKPIKAEAWAKCKGELSKLDGLEAFGGIDLGRSHDFAAVSLVFPFDDIDSAGNPCKRYELKSWAWTCEQADFDLTQEPYCRWISEKRLAVSPGNEVSFAAVKAKILECASQFNVRSWAYDPTFAGQMGQELENDHGLSVFRFTQAHKHYNEPLRRFLAAVASQKILHDGDACLEWQAGNLIVSRNPKDEWMPDKINSKGKIDGMVGGLMAFSESLYAQRATATVAEVW